MKTRLLKKITAIVCVAFSGCVSVSKHDTDSLLKLTIMPEDVRPFFEEFMELCDKSKYARRCQKNLLGFYGVQYIDKLEEVFVGHCTYFETFYQKFSSIKLRADYKNKPYYVKKALIFHELAHCLLDFDHVEDGIMEPSLSGKYRIKENWERWIEELFNGTNQTEIKYFFWKLHQKGHKCEKVEANSRGQTSRHH